MRHGLVAAIAIAIALGLSVLPAVAGDAKRGSGPLNGHGAAGAEEVPGEPDVDVRQQRLGTGPSAAQRRAAEALGEEAVRWNEQLGVPAVVIRRGSRLTAASPAAPEVIARQFLARNAQLYGFSPADLGGLRLVKAFQTPDTGSHHLYFQQTVAGIDVFQAILTVTVDRQGRVVLAAGPVYRGIRAPRVDAALSAEDAVHASAATVGAEAPGRLRRLPVGPRGELRFRNDFAPGLGEPHPVTAERVVFADPDGSARLGWRTVVEVGLDGMYESVVDANTGGVLYRRNLVQAEHRAEGNVYRVQHPLIPGAVQQITSFEGAAHNNDGWVDDNQTRGNNAIVFHDPNGTGDPGQGYFPTSPSSGNPGYQHFNYAFTDAFWQSGLVGGVPGQDGTDVMTDRDAVVTQAFYYVNLLHDRYYAHGFTEPAGNFQQDNFGRGGAEGDPVLVRVDFDFNNGACCNAFMNTPADGSSPRLTLLVGLWQGLQGGEPWPGTPPRNRNMHRAMNGDTVAHEWVHGLTNRLVGGGSLGSGAQANALGEGWSDAYATSIWNDPVYGEYNNDNFNTGIRGVSYADNTLVYSDLCQMSGSPPVCQEHTDGRIWATAMWDQRTYLTNRYGLNTGTFRHERLMTHGLMNTPTSPSFLDARDGILAADETNYGGAHQCGIWVVMANREMGTDAVSTSQSNVTGGTALPAECVPTADAGGPYTVAEGSTIQLDATASTEAEHFSGGALSFAWDLTDNGEFDDAVGATPTFGPVGDNGSYPVAVRVTNEAGASDVATVVVEVTNVAPTVTIDVDQTTEIDEGDTVTVTAHFSDPGWLDTHTAVIEWGTPAGDATNVTPVVTDLGDPGPVEGTVAASFQYGDRGVFTVTVTVTDKDGGEGSAGFDLTVHNVDPTATIDLADAVLLNGKPTIITAVNEEVTVTARATDPGSDDLTFTWDWDDGSPPTATTYLNDEGVGPDPFPSPEVNPRDVTDSQSHTWTEACLYELTLTATDDDGGSHSDTVAVIVVGDADERRSAGYWHNQYRAVGGGKDFSDDELECYLDIVGYASAVFHGVRDASTIEAAAVVLNAAGQQSDRDQLDRQLLAAWLNFANGAIRLDELVDTTRDRKGDTEFGVVLEWAEAVRLDPISTGAQLDEAKNLLDRINNGRA
jgi:hypothetical protein